MNIMDPIAISRKIVDRLLEKNEQHDSEILAGIEGERFHTFETPRMALLISDGHASEALQIAAMAHDIERFTVRGAGRGYQGRRTGKAYEDYKKEHARRGAEIMGKKLTKERVSQELIDRVKFLIAHHDDPYDDVQAFHDEELEMMVTADTLSWINSFAPDFFNGRQKSGIPGFLDKLDFMLRKIPERFWKYIPEIPFTVPEMKPYFKEHLEYIANERGIAAPTFL